MTRILCLYLTITMVVAGAMVEAQPRTAVRRIGYLSPTSASVSPSRIEAFRKGLRELGYVEGKNILIEYRYAEGKFDRLPALAAELVGLNVDLIVTTGPSVTRAAKAATTTVPIVMTTDTDPVGNGFVISLGRPGGNITGLSAFAPELSGKQLEVLKEVVPRLSHVAVFGTSTNPGNRQILREVKLAAESFGVKLQYLDVLSRNDINTAFQAARKERLEAVLYLVAGLVGAGQRKEITAMALKSRLPAIYRAPLFVEDGGLMSYGVNTADLDRRAAAYVDKILKGRKPADLPVEQPTKFELVINLKTAKQIGLIIPPQRAGESGSGNQVSFARLRSSAVLILIALVVTCSSAKAQQPTKVIPIGYLTGESLSANAARTESFRQGLRELGYVEGKNIVIEWR